jgi:hypothetical protein
LEPQSKAGPRWPQVPKATCFPSTEDRAAACQPRDVDSMLSFTAALSIIATRLASGY